MPCSATTPALDDGNLLRGLDRGQAVRNDQHGAPGLHALQRLLHQRLALRVQRAGRLHGSPRTQVRALAKTHATGSSTLEARDALHQRLALRVQCARGLREAAGGLKRGLMQ